jgi:hypothetical protein
MWCVPKLDEHYVARMDDVLDTLAQPPDAAEPVVALDERPVVLRDSARQGRPGAPGRLARMDYEYVRRGTANIFCIVEPKVGRHMTFATPNRKAVQFARALRKIAHRYPSARTIHLVLDNLSTHSQNSLCTAFGDQAGRALWNRFTVHYTPKHGSWLNPPRSRRAYGRASAWIGSASARSPSFAGERLDGTLKLIGDAARSPGGSRRNGPARCSSSTRSIRLGRGTSTVGARVAPGPPYRSGRAELPHPAPALGSGAEAHCGIGMRDSRER